MINKTTKRNSPFAYYSKRLISSFSGVPTIQFYALLNENSINVGTVFVFISNIIVDTLLKKILVTLVVFIQHVSTPQLNTHHISKTKKCMKY